MKLNNPNYLNGLTVSVEQINAAVEGGGTGLTPEQTTTLDKLDGITSSASEIDGNIFCHPQVAKFKYELERGQKNLKVFVTSDSTGNASNEWVYYFTEWLSANFPDYTTYWYEWDSVNNVYLSPVSFGSGHKRVDVMCFGVGGTRPDFVFSHWQKAVVEILDTTLYSNTSSNVDLIICNHSHNLYDELDHLLECRYEEVIEELLLTFEGSGVVVFHQNPYRDDDTSRLTSRNGALNYANRRGFAVADVNKLFYNLGKDVSLYSDNVHPTVGLGTEDSPTGTRLFLNSLTSLFNGNAKLVSQSSKSNLCLKSNNLLANGNLQLWSNPAIVPDNFYPYTSTYTSITLSKDTSEWETIKSGTAGYSMKIETTGSNQSKIELTALQCGNGKLKNTWVTLGVRCKKNAASTSVGVSPVRVQLKTTSQTFTPTSYGFSNNSTNWVWKIGKAYVGNDGVLSATIYIDASPSTGFILNIDRIVLCKGMSLFD